MQRYTVQSRISSKDSDVKIFRASPRHVMQGKNKIIVSNIFGIVLCIVAFIVGLIFSINPSDIESQTGPAMMICSLVMLGVLTVSMPYSLAKYNSMMSRVHIKVLKERIKGVTVDEDDSYIAFDFTYGEIAKIFCDKTSLTIALKEGQYYQFDIFSNPREVYNEIEKIRKERLDEEGEQESDGQILQGIEETSL